jgi:5'-methylthioadenosine phosphorylase
VLDSEVVSCTEGIRLETPAEIEMLRRLGCDLVGMTVVPEAVLARELEMCYAMVCFVSNLAAAIRQQWRLTVKEVIAVGKESVPVIQQILRETISILSQKRQCPCVHSLQDARFRG